MHAISSYHGNRPTHTHKHTQKPTDRTDYNTLHHSVIILIGLLFNKRTVPEYYSAFHVIISKNNPLVVTSTRLCKPDAVTVTCNPSSHVKALTHSHTPF